MLNSEVMKRTKLSFLPSFDLNCQHFIFKHHQCNHSISLFPIPLLISPVSKPSASAFMITHQSEKQLPLLIRSFCFGPGEGNLTNWWEAGGQPRGARGGYETLVGSHCLPHAVNIQSKRPGRETRRRAATSSTESGLV